jgi:hypothetical protein
LSVVGGFELVERDVAKYAVQSPVVVPVNPFHGGVLDVIDRLGPAHQKRTVPADHLGLEQPNVDSASALSRVALMQRRYRVLGLERAAGTGFDGLAVDEELQLIELCWLYGHH